MIGCAKIRNKLYHLDIIGESLSAITTDTHTRFDSIIKDMDTHLFSILKVIFPFLFKNLNMKIYIARSISFQNIYV